MEYCNLEKGTRWSELRRQHGYEKPHNVKYWCLGNEMDGPWQIGHLEAEEYARKAREAAKIMKWHDPSIHLVLCGSSGTSMATYPEWDRLALETCYEQVDYLSLHYYAGNRAGDTPGYLALARQFENHLDTLAGTLRYVKSMLRSKHDVYLSWDEWNVWYKDQSMNGGWSEAPHLIEEVYNLEDALVVAQWMNVFLRRCDVLKMACLAQLVNIIAPILTRRDGLLRQSIFYPFKLFSQNARGVALDVLCQSPLYETREFGPTPLLDVSASYDAASGKSAAFVVNRSLKESETAEVEWQGWSPGSAVHVYQLAGDDPKAANSFENPNMVVSRDLGEMHVQDGRVTLQLPPLSFTVLISV
jgi:alpha-N-arabinofuranosidase